MTTRAPQAAYLSLCILDLDPRAKDKRLELLKLLAQVALLDKGHPLTLPQIQLDVESILQQRGSVPTPAITSAIDSAVTEGLLVPADGNAFALHESRVTELSVALGTLEATRIAFRTGLWEAIQRRLGDSAQGIDTERLCDGIELFLQGIVHAEILELSSGTLKFEDLVAKFPEGVQQQSLERALEDALPTDLRHLAINQVFVGVRDYFRVMPTAARHHLESLQVRVLGAQLLNLDPANQEHLRSLFSARQLILDTNVVMAWQFEADEQYDLAVDVISASRALGCNLAVTPLTVEELKGQLEEARRDAATVRGSAFAAALGSSLSSVVLRTFFLRRANNAGLEWNAFIAPYADLEEYLFAQGVLVEPDARIDPHDSRIQELTNILSEFKSDSTANALAHDAQDLLYVETQRPAHPTDELGCAVWYLTLDNGLLRAQGSVHARFRDQGLFRLPTAAHLSVWGARIARYQNALTFVYDDYIAYLVKSKLGLMVADRRGIDVDFLEILTKAVVDIPRLLELPEALVRNVVIALQEDAEARALIREIATEDEPEWRALKEEKLVRTLLGLVKKGDKQVAQDLDPERATILAKIEILAKKLELSASERAAQDTQLADLQKHLDDLQARFEEETAELRKRLEEEQHKSLLTRVLERLGMKRR